MCGLFGMIGPGIVTRDFDILDDLMLVSSTRGTDGTGVVAGRGRKGMTHKLVGDPFYWRMMLKNDKRMYDMMNNFFIGHTRWRSVGKVEPGAVQPFVFDKIIGTHNGTILSSNWEGYSTDSMKLIWDLNDSKRDYDKVFSELYEDDAFALAWLDIDKHTMYFANNGWRGLAFATNKNRSVLYWASELRFLYYALHKEDCAFYTFNPNKLYSVDLHKVSSAKMELEYLNVRDLPAPKKKIIKLVETDKKTTEVIEGETLEDLRQIPWMRDTENGKLVEVQTEEQEKKVMVH